MRASAQATGLPLAVIALVAGLVVFVLLFRTQRWLSRRTHRTVNVGLGLASVATVAALIWLVVALAGGRSDLLQATTHGSGPAETLAQADITALQARGDQTLNLISRTGDANFQQDFHAAQTQLSSELSSASAQSAADGAGQITAAGHAATAWFAVNQRAQQLDAAADYGAETQLEIGSGPGTAGTLFSQLESDLEAAINTEPGRLRLERGGGLGRVRRPGGRHHRARRDHGGRLRLGTDPAPGGVPMTIPVLTKEQAPAVVQAAVAERDAIQANLLELDGSFGKRLLEGATLSGETKRRWEATAASLANLWEIYSAYSAVVDRAADTVNGHLGPRELAAITNLLTGPSIQLATGPAPLAGRDLADSGREDLSVVAAVTRMRRAFGPITEVVSATEQVVNEMTGKLDGLTAELSRVTPLAASLADEALTGNLAAAREQAVPAARHAELRSALAVAGRPGSDGRGRRHVGRGPPAGAGHGRGDSRRRAGPAAGRRAAAHHRGNDGRRRGARRLRGRRRGLAAGRGQDLRRGAARAAARPGRPDRPAGRPRHAAGRRALAPARLRAGRDRTGTRHRHGESPCHRTNRGGRPEPP